MSVSTQLKSMLASSNLSQAAFADRLGITRARLSNYLTGRSEPDCATLCRIADVLHVSADYILGRKLNSPDTVAHMPGGMPALHSGPEKPQRQDSGTWMPVYRSVSRAEEDRHPEILGWFLDARHGEDIDWGPRQPYGLLIDDDALAPNLVRGDLVFIQPRLFSCPYSPLTMDGGLFSVRLSRLDTIGLSVRHCAVSGQSLVFYGNMTSEPPVLMDVGKLLYAPVTGVVTSMLRDFSTAHMLPGAAGGVEGRQ
ncbi:MAG: helix-turn-helix transcriptional regulator [Mailhella sp.]|nr:helix-turn-helix transcriptional regulator [Mailhella sp.]